MIVRSVFIFVIFLGFLQPISTYCPDTWGSPSSNLQIVLCLIKTNSTLGFQIGFRNEGDKDMYVNLGMVVAGTMLPDAINVVLIDSIGRQRDMQYFDRRFSAIAARVDPYVVSLRSRSEYFLTIPLDNFKPKNTKEWPPLNLPAGKYTAYAYFVGAVPAYIGPDAKNFNYWKGRAKSNSIEFKL